MAFACKLKLARGPQGFPTTGHVNEENVETYPIWPYEFFSVNRSAEVESVYPLAVGKNTFDGVHFPHGDSVGRHNITGILHFLKIPVIFVRTGLALQFAGGGLTRHGQLLMELGGGTRAGSRDL